MRRNLVGKKLPQQPKLAWTDTVTFDADALTGAQLKAIRTDNADLPRSGDLHWVQIADGVANQFKRGDHMALSSAFHSLRSNTMSNINISVKLLSDAPGITTDRVRRSFMPGVGGNTTAAFTDVTAPSGSITNVPGGGVHVENGSNENTRLGWTGLSGTISYGAKSRTIVPLEFFRVRFKISGLVGYIVPRIDGVQLDGPNGEIITSDGIYTWYCKADGNNSSIDFALQFGIYQDYSEATVEYMHLDVMDSPSSTYDRIDNRTATTDGLLIGVRANGATAYVDARDTYVAAGYQRGLYQDVLPSTAYNWGRSSDYRPGHEKETVASAGNVLDDGWYGLSQLAVLPVKDLWAQLYANNSAIGADIDPTAEWFVAHDIPLFLPDWSSSTESDFTAGTYSYPDAWAKDCAVRWQVSVGAVSAPTWDNNWKRAHSGYALFARNATGDKQTWDYENYNNPDFPDEPNDFTLEALGITLGTQQFFELCDDADGSQIDISGTTPAFRGARGKILTSGHDFSVIAAGDEFVANYGRDNPGPFANAPWNFEWRAVTFIAESGQLVDITSSGIDTESSVPHWSHATCVFGFVN